MTFFATIYTSTLNNCNSKLWLNLEVLLFDFLKCYFLCVKIGYSTIYFTLGIELLISPYIYDPFTEILGLVNRINK